MKKHTTLFLIFLLNYIASASFKIQEIDCKLDLKINSIGPVLMLVDSSRNRIITANALSSSVSVIDTRTHAVQNIPVAKRTVQFLKSESLYFLRGATAVNGVFGAAVSVFHPDSEKVKKIRTGWAPIDLIEFDSTSFLVFNNEDQFCRIFANGTQKLHQLPFDFPLQAIDNGYGDIYLSYGAH
jgi:DNA-binding beta-propeller fold protein YncE